MKKSILDTRMVIPKIFELFSQFTIHASWATIGMLRFRNKLELLEEFSILRFGNSLFSKLKITRSAMDLAFHFYQLNRFFTYGEKFEQVFLEIKAVTKVELSPKKQEE